MSQPKILISFYSRTSTVEGLAKAVAEGASAERAAPRRRICRSRCDGLWVKGALNGKLGLAFAGSATPHGASVVSGNPPSGSMPEELDVVHFQGRRVAQIAKKLVA
jgi:multimeric flavodoxin WrbA